MDLYDRDLVWPTPGARYLFAFAVGLIAGMLWVTYFDDRLLDAAVQRFQKAEAGETACMAKYAPRNEKGFVTDDVRDATTTFFPMPPVLQ